MAQTPNFGIKLPQPGDMVFGKTLIDALTELDQKLFEALYGDNLLFLGASLAIADPGVGLSAPAPLTPLPEVIYPTDVTLKKVRIIIPALTNTIAAPGIQLNFRKVGTLPRLLTASIAVPSAAGLDTVVDFPAGVDILNTEEVELIVTNSTLAPIAGAFDVEMALASDILYPEE